MRLTDGLLAAAGFAAGAQNALAGGGSFVTFPALLYAGLDPRAANIASTIALFPGQMTTSFTGRSMVRDAAGLSVKVLVAISLVGGGVGAVLLLATPVSVFTHLVPYLVLFATLVFAWGSFMRKTPTGAPIVAMSPRKAMLAQALIAVYGGYFGGGIGILMLAALTAAGLAVRHAGATKNFLAGVINVAAVVIFMWRTDIAWREVVIVAIAAIIGGQLGVFLLRRINETMLRVGITAIGLAVAVALFKAG
ncbi:MAG: sulfite exporter TauE/SafE family protein [Acidocella sp.]|nr:sulfite exporter TauE/SafE family protein [Acidocella sp.]